MNVDATLHALREALRLSPDNIVLRRHLADTLAGCGKYAEAEVEYRRALAAAPNDLELKTSLAQTYYQQSKASHCMVIVEDLAKHPDAPARALVLYSRLLAAGGDQVRAASMYRRAMEMDESAADNELASRLGVSSQPAERIDSFEEPDAQAHRESWSGEEPSATNVEIEQPEVNFSDVGGLESLKEQIRLKIIHPLNHPEVYQAYGKKVGGGILMYGPPGCGKTHLARATAGEINASFLSIGISDVLDMWIGSSEKNLHELFEQARSNRPCVLFFDEVDALGGSRTDLRHSGVRHLVNQFLSELDGVKTNNEGVLILAATNAPWHLDNAFRRPGRFDRILFVPPPDEGSRMEILRVLLQGKPVENPDFQRLAKASEEYSGADLKAVLDVAVEAKLAQAMKTGVPLPLTTKDLLDAMKTVKPTTRDWFATARNYALYSNQNGLYDDILKYLKIK